MQATVSKLVPKAASPDNDEFFPRWGTAAPRGGRILKEGKKVPLFLGQTFIDSLRDVGYNSTTSAVCEHVDNAIQAGATEIRIYFHQTRKRGAYNIDTLVYDNGRSMDPNVLQVAQPILQYGRDHNIPVFYLLYHPLDIPCTAVLPANAALTCDQTIVRVACRIIKAETLDIKLGTAGLTKSLHH